MGHLAHLQGIISIFSRSWGSPALVPVPSWTKPIGTISFTGILSLLATWNQILLLHFALYSFIKDLQGHTWGQMWLTHTVNSQNLSENFHNRYQKVWISVYSAVSLPQKFSAASCHAQVCISFMNEGLLCIKIKILCLSAMKRKKKSLWECSSCKPFL